MGTKVEPPVWVDRTDRGRDAADWRVDRCYVLGDWVIGTVEKFQPPSESTYVWCVTENMDGSLAFNRLGAFYSLPGAVDTIEARANAIAAIYGGWSGLHTALERQEEVV